MAKAGEEYRNWENFVKGIHAGILYRYRKLLALGVGSLLLLSLGLWWIHRPGPGEGVSGEEWARFSSEEEFLEYVSSYEPWYGFYVPGLALPGMAMRGEGVGFSGLESPEASRISETTVQVKGIDEPDVVKTDGRYVYFSEGQRGIYPFWRGEELPPSPETKVIKAFPPSDLSLTSRIERSGEMLLTDNLLLLFSYDGIAGYDVSDPGSPREVWAIQLDSVLVSARLYGKNVYFVTRSEVSSGTSWPLLPMKVKGESFAVEVNEVYHPPDTVPVDAVYTAAMLDPKEGEIKRSVSFVGHSDTSVVYMSPEALYITYTYSPSPVRVFYRFLKERCEDLIPAEVMARIDRLMGYEISDRAKLVELGEILASGKIPMEETQERMEEYVTEKSRELVVTGIVKIGLENFEIAAQGEVPGRPLNQFSLDEEGGYLRLATTIQPYWWSWSWSVNDVYVLDSGLRTVGSVRDLGKGEEIYAVRFLGDKGYVVTFRETDPFYVLDLSDPERPELKGELKIPGYSSYLHPINPNLILGVGRENWKVKVSLFDVSSPSNPLELDRYLLEESWSEVLETHHAFLLDEKHAVFFLPTERGGYVFSYGENRITPVKELSVPFVKRAIYLEDYLYVIAEGRTVVIDEETWEKVNELEW